MSLTAGSRLGPYEILTPLGAGGMGQVWRARDVRLQREVAVKVLPDLFSTDPERLARFERESQILASLNHPHIATIHGIEDASPGQALVMELVPGPTVADRIAQGPVPLAEALRLARDVADALDAAHDRGIVHRDLKPANLKLTEIGRVKVLDFGLATAAAVSSGAMAAVTASPTMPAVTLAGTVLGTAAYMSPEQARGLPVDRRTDVWAFGCVLYEMLTGQRPFAGASLPDLVAAILRIEPDWTQLPAETPAMIRRLLDRCLRKRVEERLSDLGDVCLLLDDVIAGRVDDSAVTSVTPPPRARRWPHAAWAAALLAVAALGAWGTLRHSGSMTPGPVRKLEIVARDLLVSPEFQRPQIAPDGHAVVYAAGRQLWIRELDALEARAVPGSTDGESPFWSPDARQLAFVAKGKLWRVGAESGAPTTVCELPDQGRLIGGVWRPDGVLVLAAWQGPIYQVPSSGGDPQVLVRKDGELDFHDLALLPDGRSFLFVPHFLEAADEVPRIEAFRDGKRTLVVPPQPRVRFRYPVVSPGGYLLYVRLGSNDGLWAVPFSADTLQARGDAFLVSPGGRVPSVAADGTLVYAPGIVAGQLVFVDRAGVRLSTIGEPLWAMASPTLSPDGTKVAIVGADLPTTDNDRRLWIYDVASGSRRRVSAETARTGDGGAQWVPSHPDVIIWPQNARQMLVWCRVTGCGAPHDLFPGFGRSTVSTSGAFVFARRGADRKLGLFASDLSGDWSKLEVKPLIAGPGEAAGPAFSPDGRFLVYISDESGRTEVYVRRFPLTDERWTLAPCSDSVRFNLAGTEVYCRRGDGAMVVVPVTLGKDASIGEARVLFNASTAVEGAPAPRGSSNVDLALGFAVAPDSQRFVAIARAAQAGAERLVVVQNWEREFQRPATPGTH
jgi:hypothetical protein